MKARKYASSGGPTDPKKTKVEGHWVTDENGKRTWWKDPSRSVPMADMSRIKSFDKSRMPSGVAAERSTTQVPVPVVKEITPNPGSRYRSGKLLPPTPIGTQYTGSRAKAMRYDNYENGGKVYASGGGPTDPKKKGSKAPAGTTKSPTGTHSVAPQGFIPGVSKQSNPNMLGYSAVDRYNSGKIGAGRYFVEQVKEAADKLKRGKEVHSGGYANGGKVGEPLKMDASAKAAMSSSAVSKKKKPALREGSVYKAPDFSRTEVLGKMIKAGLKSGFSKGGKIYAEGGGPTDPKKKLTPEQKKARREMDFAVAKDLDQQIARGTTALKSLLKNKAYQATLPGGKKVKRVRLGMSLGDAKRVRPTKADSNRKLDEGAAKYSIGETLDMLRAERDYALSNNPDRKRRRPVPIFREGDTGGIAKEIMNKRLKPLAGPKSGTIRRQIPPIKP